MFIQIDHDPHVTVDNFWGGSLDLHSVLGVDTCGFRVFVNLNRVRVRVFAENRVVDVSTSNSDPCTREREKIRTEMQTPLLVIVVSVLVFRLGRYCS